MSRRFPVRVLVLWALAAALVLASAGLFGYGRLGGTTPTGDEPYQWDGRASLVISYQGGGIDEATGPGCRVRPATGEERTFDGRRARGGEVRVRVVEPWFPGTAEVTCDRAKVLTGPAAPLVDQWFTGLLLALGVTVVSAPILSRYRRRHSGGPAGAAG